MTTPKWISCKLITEIYLQDDLSSHTGVAEDTDLLGKLLDDD